MRPASFLKTAYFLFFSILLFSACLKKDNKRFIRSYYYPYHQFKDGKVYEYRAVGNEKIAPFYWYFRSTRKDNTTYLTSQYYDHNFVIQQLTNEEIVDNGTLMIDYFLYATDSLTGKQIQNPVNIEVNNVFPFEVSDSSNYYRFQVYWTDYDNPQQKIRLVRNRQFVGDAEYTFNNKKVDCVKFDVKELLEVEEVGFQDLEYNGVELYAKNIGLVYFSKEIAPNITQAYELADIYEMSNLEAKFKQSLEN